MMFLKQDDDFDDGAWSTFPEIKIIQRRQEDDYF
jgi:hypothetical protein